MDESDDLSRITGIGLARARWLEKTFGVRRFGDLAALSPDEIEGGLKAKGRERVSRRTIESWVAEAKTLASEEERGPATTASEGGPGSPQGEPSEWQPVASFVIEFQSRAGEEAEPAWRTAVHYLERDLNETWSGIDCDGLCRWMTEGLEEAQGGAAPELGPVEAEAPGPPRPAPEARAAGAEPPAAPQPRPRLALRAHVVDGDGVEHPNLIPIDKPWTVVFTWWPEDELPPAEGAEWELAVLLRPLGYGMPLGLPGGPLRLPIAGPRTDDRYRYRYEVAAGVVTSSHLDTPYRASATVLLWSTREDRVLLSGFVDMGLVRFYERSGAGGAQPSPLAGVQTS